MTPGHQQQIQQIEAWLTGPGASSDDNEAVVQWMLDHYSNEELAQIANLVDEELERELAQAGQTPTTPAHQPEFHRIEAWLTGPAASSGDNEVVIEWMLDHYSNEELERITDLPDEEFEREVAQIAQRAESERPS